MGKYIIEVNYESSKPEIEIFVSSVYDVFINDSGEILDS